MRNHSLVMFLLSFLIGVVILIMQNIVEPMALNNITKELQEISSATRLIVLLALFMFASVGMSIVSSLNDILREKIRAALVPTRVVSLISKILYTHNNYLSESEPEKIVNRISRDTATEAATRLKFILDTPIVIIALCCTAYMMFFGSFPWLEQLGFSAQRGNVVLATVVVCISPLHLAFLLFNKKYATLEQQQVNTSETTTLVTTESLRSAMDTRASNCFEFVIQRMTAALTRTFRAQVKMFALCTVFQNIRCLVWGGSQVVVLSVASWLIFKHESGFCYADYVGFSALCGMFNNMVVQAVELILEWQKSKQARVRLFELDTLPAVFSPRVDAPCPRHNGSLSFVDVSYRIADTQILDSINFSISAGQHVALVGPSGCGKSTLLKMAIRHLAPSTGKVTYAGNNIEELDFSHYISKIAYVSQKPFMFQGTIRENIFVGRDIPVTQARLLEILDDVALSGDLLKLNPVVLKALDTPVKSEGQSLSGGQIAKIALARALIADPEILLLDEITSPLDELSQDHIMRTLKIKYSDKTILSISHRMPAVRDMDKIAVLESGRLVQTGTYDELSARPGLFATLVARETGIPVPATLPPLPFDESVRGIIQTLSLSPVFAAMNASSLLSIAQSTTTITIPAGKVLFQFGDPGDSLYIIKSGTVEIAGRTFGPGQSFGEIAVFGDISRTATVLASSNCTLLEIHKEKLLPIISNAPHALLSILRATAQIAARESAK